jgi:hypothetical protein
MRPPEQKNFSAREMAILRHNRFDLDLNEPCRIEQTGNNDHRCRWV